MSVVQDKQGPEMARRTMYEGFSILSHLKLIGHLFLGGP